MASRAAYNTFRRVYSNPEMELRTQRFTTRRAVYNFRWAYYNNSVFDDLAQWGVYKGDNRLYRFTRSIYNPCARLVDFYVGSVYPGRLSVEPDEPSAIPLGEETSPQLRTAIDEVYRASNWQTNKGVMLRYGAALGETLVEIVDEPERGLVYLNNVWPGTVVDLELDNRGNVKMYAQEYDVEERTDNDTFSSYTYRKEVDGTSFRFYRDRTQVNSYPNPYGFVPACWCVHRNEGGMFGAPALRNYNKLDEANSLATHANDYLHKLMAAPVLVASSGGITGLSADSQPKKGASEDNQREREMLPVLKGPQDSSIQSVEFGDLTGVKDRLEQMITEIEHDHPELTFYNQLREMSQVTGPAAQRLMGDVQSLVVDAQANYDQQMIKALQMAVAIGGWRLSQGDWGPSPNTQQEAYRGFDLDSYRRGDLDFTIDERPLIPLTKEEQIRLEREELSLQADRQGMMAANQPQAIANRLRGVPA